VEDDYDRVRADCARRWGASDALQKAVVDVPVKKK